MQLIPNINCTFTEKGALCVTEERNIGYLDSAGVSNVFLSALNELYCRSYRFPPLRYANRRL